MELSTISLIRQRIGNEYYTETEVYAKKRNRQDNTLGRMPACNNERFHKSVGVCPQTVLREFGSLSPAQTFVKPRLREVANTLGVSGGQYSGTTKQEIER